MIPSGYVKIAIENGPLIVVFPIKNGDFHSYVSLPEGTWEIARRNGSYQNGKHVIPRQGIRPPLLCSKSFRPSISVLSHAPLS